MHSQIQKSATHQRSLKQILSILKPRFIPAQIKTGSLKSENLTFRIKWDIWDIADNDQFDRTFNHKIRLDMIQIILCVQNDPF